MEYLLRELESISNLTQGTEEKAVYMKDSAISHQKSSPQGDMLNLMPLNIVLSPVFKRLHLNIMIIYPFAYFDSKSSVIYIVLNVFFKINLCDVTWHKLIVSRSSRLSNCFFLISDSYFKKASSMLSDVRQFEKTIIAQDEQILWVWMPARIWHIIHSEGIKDINWSTVLYSLWYQTTTVV